MTEPLLPSTIGTQPRHITFLTTTTVVRKTDSQTGSPCQTNLCLGGYLQDPGSCAG